MASFTLHATSPFRLDLTVWALRRLPTNAVDLWDGRTYQRVHVLGETPVAVAVEQKEPPEATELRVRTPEKRMNARLRSTIAAVLGKTLGLDADLGPFYRLAAADKRLGPLVGRFAGLKPPRLPTVFEALVNAFACQQLSLNVGIALLNRLCTAYGRAAGGQTAFPSPQDLAEARSADLRKLGYSGRKAECILWLARRIADGEQDLEALAELDDAAAFSRLIALPGVGRWSAQYVMLRSLGRLNVIPVDDVGMQSNLQRWLKLKERPDADALRRRLAPWHPYGGMLYFHLLLDHLMRGGIVKL